MPKPSLIHLRASLWEEGSHGCKLPWAASTHKLALQLGKEKNLDSSENITCFHWSADQPLWSLHHSTSSECWYWKTEVSWWRLFHAIQLYWAHGEHFGSKLDYSDVDSTQQSLWRRCFLPTMCFNARRFLSVGLEDRPVFLWLLEVFPVLLEFCYGPWYGKV